MAPNVRCHLSVLLALPAGIDAAWAAGALETPRQDMVAVKARVPFSDPPIRIEASADAPTEQPAAPVAPGADAEDALDAGAIPARGDRKSVV